MPFANTYDPNSYASQARQQIQGAQAQGLFNPQGSPGLRAAVRAGALRNADNLRRRQSLLSQLMGLDPNQARVAAVNADAAGSANTAGALNDASLQQMLGGQQFARGLFMNQLGNEQQLANAKALAKYQRDISNPGIGGFLGQAAGFAIPGLAGLFRRGGGGVPQTQIGSPGVGYVAVNDFGAQLPDPYEYLYNPQPQYANR